MIRGTNLFGAAVVALAAGLSITLVACSEEAKESAAKTVESATQTAQQGAATAEQVGADAQAALVKARDDAHGALTKAMSGVTTQYTALTTQFQGLGDAVPAEAKSAYASVKAQYENAAKALGDFKSVSLDNWQQVKGTVEKAIADLGPAIQKVMDQLKSLTPAPPAAPTGGGATPPGE